MQLPHDQHLVLDYLVSQPGLQAQLSDIIAGTQLDQSRVSQVVTALEQRGLVTKSRVAGTTRKLASVTDFGKLAAEQSTQSRLSILSGITAHARNMCAVHDINPRELAAELTR